MKRLRRLLLFFLAGLILVLSPAVDFHRPASPAEVAPATTQVEGVELPDLGQITFSTLPAIAESGSFTAPPEVVEALGYDPSRSWSAGQTAEEYLKLGDFQESFQLQKYNLETLATMGGTSAETAKLSDFELLNRQTIGDLVTAVPELANRQISEVSPIADLLSQSVGNAFDPTQTLGFVAQNSDLSQLSLGGIDLTIYDLNSIPGLKFAPLETFREWQNTLLKGVPGLKDIPWSQFLNPVTLSGGIGKVDVVLGSAEKNRAYTISGSYKEGFQVPCLQESCPHIEMAGLPLLKGRQWISGKAQKVKGGHGILGMVNGGKEPTGRHPFGNAFKVVLTAAKEAEAKAEFGLYFRFCAKTKFVDFGCTPYVIGPIPWIPAKEKDWIFLGFLEGIDKKAEAFKKPPAVGTPPINGNPFLPGEDPPTTTVKTLKGEVTDFNTNDLNFSDGKILIQKGGGLIADIKRPFPLSSIDWLTLKIFGGLGLGLIGGTILVSKFSLWKRRKTLTEYSYGTGSYSSSELDTTELPPPNLSKAGLAQWILEKTILRDLPPGTSSKLAVNNHMNRHFFENLDLQPKGQSNSYILGKPATQAEIFEIYKEAVWKAVYGEHGEYLTKPRYLNRAIQVTLDNGQTWKVNPTDGTLFPMKGNNIIVLNRKEAVYIETLIKKINSGISPKEALEAVNQMRLNDGKTTISANMEKALRELQRIKNISEADIAGTFGNIRSAEDLGLTKDAAKALDEAAKVKAGNRAYKFVKWGGRILLVIGLAADGYEIYAAENKEKKIVEKAGAWAGSAAGAWAFGSGAATTLSWINGAPGPGTAAYAVIVGGAAIVGGFVGYNQGAEIAKTVYEWFFEKVE